MDLRWLEATDDEVARGIARTQTTERPHWVPTRRQLLLHVNNCLLLWALAVSWFVLGVRIDTLQDNRITPTDVRDMAIVVVVFIAWGAVTYALVKWARKSPSSPARLAEWRQQLTGVANGFTSSPTNQRTFPGLITSGGRATLFHPRFTRGEVEFGNLSRRRNSGDQWSYLSVQLAVPVPHLVLKSHRAGDLAKQLPVWVAPSQRLPLEGDFDSWFHAYAPSGYERDALFILVPDVMAALIDSASTFHIELIDHRVTFFVPGHRRFTDPESWRAVDALLQGALPPIASAAVRYRDERVPGQNDSLTVAAILAAVQSPGEAWVEPRRVVDARGARLRMLDFRTGWWGILRGVAWAISMVLLYVVPGLFLFAAIMSIVDGH
ncbi:hypothetical protein [Leucobacter salsicius]|uniref:hypothetical protein n=1 Tax=Leucobacter salsicius TaxID=664638 RepID=UPI0012F9727A|nr:hypothetical protein [Leucobacter salsicius]